MDLKDVAVNAYQKKEEKEREAILYYQAEREQKIKNLLDRHGITGVEIIDNVVAANDLKFRVVFRNGDPSGWQILGKCPKCQQQKWSAQTFGLSPEHIGSLIQEPFRPDYDHYCEQSAQSVEYRLVDLIRELIREETQGE